MLPYVQTVEGGEVDPRHATASGSGDAVGTLKTVDPELLHGVAEYFFG